MENILEKLWAQMASHMSELRAEIAAREKFREQLQAAVAKQPIVLGELHGVLQRELERRSAAAQSSAASVQVSFTPLPLGSPVCEKPHVFFWCLHSSWRSRRFCLMN